MARQMHDWRWFYSAMLAVTAYSCGADDAGPPHESACSDGADNDRDGHFDCQDPDCATACAASAAVPDTGRIGDAGGGSDVLPTAEAGVVAEAGSGDSRDGPDAAIGPTDLAAADVPTADAPALEDVPVAADIPPKNQPPNCAIVTPKANATGWFDEDFFFAATATDPEDGPLPASAVQWQSTLKPLIAIGNNKSHPLQPDGVHQVTCTAQDSAGLVGTSAPVSVTVKSPHAAIWHPANNETRAVGVPIPFKGNAKDLQDGTLVGAALQWSSDLEGPFGTGVEFSKALNKVGTHTITLKVTDKGGTQDMASILLVVK
ncbi:MAG: hypothetical protein EXR79_04640 [Myxococcales bacterium]|nr:hypothetical protein [Myxococcales bacterium]